MGRTHVIGPETSTDNTIAVWDGVTGKLLEDSGQTIADVIASASVGSGISQLTGDVTAGPGTGSQAATIANDAVTNAKLANVATATLKGRSTAGTGDPEDLTATQATALLNAMVGDSGSGGTKGLVPAPSAGDTAAGNFLKADGSWSAPSGSGAPSSAHYVTTQTESGLSAEFSLGSLTSGILKHTVAGSVSTPATASAGSDYVAPGGALGTPSSGDATNITNIPVANALSGSVLPVANGGTGWTYIVTTSDHDVSSNTVVANDSELFFSMTAAKLYEFELHCAYSSPAGAGTPDFKFTFAGPATLTGGWAIFQFLGTTDAAGALTSQTTLTATGTLGTAATPRMVIIYGWAYSTGGGSGTSGLILQWAQTTSSANATRVHQGSYFRYRQVT